MMIWSRLEADEAPITVTVADQARLLSDLGEWFESGRGFSIATLNLDHVVKLARDKAFHAAYAQHTHVTADGNPIVWLTRLAGQRDVSLIPGSELIEPLAQLAQSKAIDIAFFGATQESLEAAASALIDRYPGMRIVLKKAPAMGFDPDGPAADAAIETIAESGARLVFVALGAPKQERFAARAAARLEHVGFVSIGAGLDFISGRQTRAPRWVRCLAGEWLWRLLSSPGRLAARYGACLVMLPALVRRALAARKGLNL